MGIYRRKVLRLQRYDYSDPGAYFVTINSYHRQTIFGHVCDGKMVRSPYGAAVLDAWHDLPRHYPNITLDVFEVMPNHVYGIVIITEDLSVRAIHESPSPVTAWERRKMLLPMIIGRFKMTSAKQINLLRKTPRYPVWQRGYYEHIVRNERSFDRIREYIIANPVNWKKERKHLL